MPRNIIHPNAIVDVSKFNCHSFTPWYEAYKIPAPVCLAQYHVDFVRAVTAHEGLPNKLSMNVE